jgi:DNA-binding MarR family transcriptional regulator
MHRQQLDNLLHQPTRLGVIAHLVRCGGEASFIDVCQALDIEHPGALSAHNRVLEDAGYLELKKFFVGRKGRTLLVLTPKGRRAFSGHRTAFAAITDSSMMEATP